MMHVFDSWISYPARAVNAEDGLRIEFTIPVHSDLQPTMSNPEKREILCKYRVRKGFLWGQLGRGATVRIEADLVTGARGGQHLHCQSVEILAGKPRAQKASPEQVRDAKRQERRMAKQAGVSPTEFRRAASGQAVRQQPKPNAARPHGGPPKSRTRKELASNNPGRDGQMTLF